MGIMYDIVKKCGYYEVYIENEFYCSADDLTEAAKEVENYFKPEKEEVLVTR